jgi:RNA polymerase sigma factor (sigma-70 family)
MTPDFELLAEFARTNSEDAFAELVRRHVNLVHAAALRQVNGDTHLAQDVAQSVFTDLAHKAGSLAHGHNASSPQSLTGWLYTSAHFAAAKIVRGENRRRDREEKFMSDTLHESAPEPGWEKLQPLLDDVMHELPESDREALLLRYFENQPFAQVGAKLGLNENAARMRVERALEKLRAALARRGVATAATLASVISANAVQIAPAGLAATLTSASLISAGTGTFTLIKIMTATQFKLGISALVVAGAATVLVSQHRAQENLRVENAALTQQLAQLKTDNASLSNRLAAPGDAQSLPADKLNELMKLRGEVGILSHQVGEAGQKAQTAEQKLTTELSSKAQFEAHEEASVNTMKEVGLTMRLYALNHNGQYPTNFEQFAPQLYSSFGYLSEITNSFSIGGISLHTFEFVNVGVPRSIENPEHPNLLELREIFARQATDGTWRRIYGFADGRVVTAISNDGNFDAWEKVNTYSPPSDQ